MKDTLPKYLEQPVVKAILESAYRRPSLAGRDGLMLEFAYFYGLRVKLAARLAARPRCYCQHATPPIFDLLPSAWYSHPIFGDSEMGSEAVTRLPGMPEPASISQPDAHASGTKVVAQQHGEAVAEAPHRKYEFADGDGMTPDKTPKNAPWWYQVAVNGSFASIVSILFIVQTLRQPSARDLQREASTTTLQMVGEMQKGIERIVDKNDRVQEKLETNIERLKTVFRERSTAQDKIVSDLQSDMREMTVGARKFHEAAENRALIARSIQEKQLQALDELPKKIADSIKK